MMCPPPNLEDSMYSSPLSSGSGSHRGTPGTILTEFSPQLTRSQQVQRSCSNSRFRQPPAFALSNEGSEHTPAETINKHEELDPFTSAERVSCTTLVRSNRKLSATAATFQPSAVSFPSYQANFSEEIVRSSMKLESQDTEAIVVPNRHRSDIVVDPSPSRHPYGAFSSSSDVLLDAPTPYAYSTGQALPARRFSGAGTRYLQISGIPASIGIEQLNDSLKVRVVPCGHHRTDVIRVSRLVFQIR